MRTAPRSRARANATSKPVASWSTGARSTHAPPSARYPPSSLWLCCRPESTASLRGDQGDRRAADARGDPERPGVTERHDVSVVLRDPVTPAVGGNEHSRRTEVVRAATDVA